MLPLYNIKPVLTILQLGMFPVSACEVSGSVEKSVLDFVRRGRLLLEGAASLPGGEPESWQVWKLPAL